MEAKDTVVHPVIVKQTVDDLLVKQANTTWALAKEYFLAQGRKEVVEWINSHTFYVIVPVKEGEKYTYLASYILKWGQESKPSYGAKDLSEHMDWHSQLAVWGIKEE